MKKPTLGDSTHPKTSRRFHSASFGSALALATMLGASSCFGADGTWIGTTDNDWDVTTNWNPAGQPTGAHTATFDNAGNGNTNVTVTGTTQPVGTILFDTAAAAAYTFDVGAGRFRLNAVGGGAITMTSSVITDQTFNNTVSLGVNDNPGNFSFLNESTSAKLIFNGLIEGDTAGAATIGIKNLNIGGAGDIDVNGVIENTANGPGSQRTVGLTKVGAGTLTISNAANIYTGFTRVTAGTLILTPTGTIEMSNEVIVSAGALLSLDAINGHTVATGKSLGGSGSATGGPVVVESGGAVVTDDGVIGTLLVDSLDLQSGWVGEFEIPAAGGTSDLVDVTDSNGLIMNDGSISLFAEGTQDPFSLPGTYTLFQYSGTLGGAPAITVSNPAPATNYAFSFVGGVVEVTITTDASFWDVDAGGSWNTATNWTSVAAPDGQNMVAAFGGGGTAITSASTVTVDGDKSVGKMIFDGVESFTINPGSPSTITFDADPTAPILQGVSGTHTVAADLVIPATFELDSEAGSDLTLSGIISGDGNIDVLEGGTVNLSGTNTYTGTTTVLDGTLNIEGDQTAANAGFAVGTTVINPVAVMNVESGALVAVDVAGSIDTGNAGNAGTTSDVIEINVAGTVTNDGTLGVRRAGDLNINSGGSWTQSGDMLLRPYGNIAGPNLTVDVGGTFTYTGTNTIKVNGPQPTVAQSGISTLTISGDFLTGAGFEEGKTVTPNLGTGRGELIIDGGTLQLTAPVADLVFALVGDIRFFVENSATIDTNGFDSTLTVPIRGGGSLTKAGLGTLIIGGGNIHAGGTFVTGGVLEINGNSLPDDGWLDVAGGIVEITADETVAFLSYDGGPDLPIGVYGSTLSAAPLANQDDTRFSGTGVLNVVGVSPYQTWADLNVGGQAPELDFDDDGTQNGIEYFLNAAVGITAQSTVVAGAVSWANGGNIAETAYGTQFEIQTSPDLLTWTPIDALDPNLSNLSGSVTYTLPVGEDAIFVQLVVTPN